MMLSESLLEFLGPLLFPEKLYELASLPQCSSVSWSSNGDSVILDTEKLPGECFIPQIFDVNDHKHVFRQLSYYGFQRIRKVCNIVEFQHPRFLSNKLDLVKTIRRPSKRDSVAKIAKREYLPRKTRRPRGKDISDIKPVADTKLEADCEKLTEEDCTVECKKCVEIENIRQMFEKKFKIWKNTYEAFRRANKNFSVDNIKERAKNRNARAPGKDDPEYDPCDPDYNPKYVLQRSIETELRKNTRRKLKYKAKCHLCRKVKNETSDEVQRNDPRLDQP